MTDKGKGVDFKKLLESAKQLNFASIDADIGGEEIGLMEGVKIDLKEDGDQIFGLLIEKEHRDKPYDSFCYQMENLENIWFFWGTKVLDSRTENISLPCLVRIICKGKKLPTTGGQAYMDFQVFEYPIPPGFDPQKHVAGIDPSDNQIKFYDKPVRVPQSSNTQEKAGK